MRVESWTPTQDLKCGRQERNLPLEFSCSNSITGIRDGDNDDRLIDGREVYFSENEKVNEESNTCCFEVFDLCQTNSSGAGRS